MDLRRTMPRSGPQILDDIARNETRAGQDSDGQGRGSLLSKRIRQAAYVFAHIRQHRRFRRAITAAACAGLVDRRRVSTTKYVGIYLSTSLDARSKRDIIQNHYRIAAEYAVFAGIADAKTIWRRAGPNGCRLLLQDARLAPKEGEYEVVFVFGEKPLCTMTFVFTYHCGDDASSGRTMVIGGVQGEPGTSALVREAAKLNGEIAPNQMLLLAARAVAEHVGADTILGVPTHLNAAALHSGEIKFDYDRFWASHGGVQRGDGLYSLSPSCDATPSEPIRSAHPSRTRRRRRRKSAIRAEIDATLKDLARAARPNPEGSSADRRRQCSLRSADRP